MRRTYIRLARALSVAALVLAVVCMTVSHLTHQIDEPRFAKEGADIMSMVDALKVYKLDVGHYPSTQVGLEALTRNLEKSPRWKGPYMGSIPVDRREIPYRYSCPGSKGAPFEISGIALDGEVVSSLDWSTP